MNVLSAGIFSAPMAAEIANEEDEPERDGADQAGRTGTRADLLDVLACIAGVQGSIESDLLQQPGDDALDEAWR